MPVEADGEVLEEIELLRAMWPDEAELVIQEACDDGSNLQRFTVISNLTPMTAGEERTQFVRCQVIIDVPMEYPAVAPCVALGSSRGLSDAQRAGLLSTLESSADELLGGPALFAILEAGREALTALNAPAGECAICLGDLDADDAADWDGSTGASASRLRTPCFHAFHSRCFAGYWRSEWGRQQPEGQGDVSGAEVACPECRAPVRWEEVPEIHCLVPPPRAQRAAAEEQVSTSLCSSIAEAPTCGEEVCKGGAQRRAVARAAELPPPLREEAFVRLHHLWQGTDEKERPLLRLLKEQGLSAMVFYGKPAMLHVQGDARDVDAFAGLAKRRHITVTIQVAQRSKGPPIPDGITPVPAKKGSLDGDAFKAHLQLRGSAETAFTILGS